TPARTPRAPSIFPVFTPMRPNGSSRSAMSPGLRSIRSRSIQGLQRISEPMRSGSRQAAGESRTSPTWSRCAQQERRLWTAYRASKAQRARRPESLRWSDRGSDVGLPTAVFVGLPVGCLEPLGLRFTPAHACCSDRLFVLVVEDQNDALVGVGVVR